MSCWRFLKFFRAAILKSTGGQQLLYCVFYYTRLIRKTLMIIHNSNDIWKKRFHNETMIFLLISILSYNVNKPQNDSFQIIGYEKTDEWYDDWQQVTANDNDWYTEWERMTGSDSEWHQVVQRVTTSGTMCNNDWQQVTTSEKELQRTTRSHSKWYWVVISAKPPFLRIRE